MFSLPNGVTIYTVKCTIYTEFVFCVHTAFIYRERKHLFDHAISDILFDMDKNAFESAKLKVLLKQNDPHGFGTLQEKTVHAVMKLYYEPDEDFHEVPVEGFIADREVRSGVQAGQEPGVRK